MNTFKLAFLTAIAIALSACKPAVTNSEAQLVETETKTATGSVVRLVLNYDDKDGSPLADSRTRQGLWSAIETSKLVDQFFKNTGTATCNVVAAPAEFVSNTTCPFSYDPSASKRLLRETGHQDGLNLTIQKADGDHAKVLEFVVAAWTAVGVNATVAENDADVQVVTTPPPTAASIETFLAGYKGNKEYQQLAAALKTETDPASRADLVKGMNDRLVKDAVTIPLVVLK